MPAISVVIPTYNRSRPVKQACQSVLNQTRSDLEIIVVDDGSTDDTRSVVGKIADSRVKYFHKENAGQSSARNQGLARATGEYVAFLDADDLWPARHLETLAAQLAANSEYGAAYARVILSRADGTEKELSKPRMSPSGWITKYFFGGLPCLVPSAILFRRSVWKGAFWDEAITTGTDYDVFLRISTKARFLFVPNALVMKRSMPDSLSNRPDPMGPFNVVRTLERFYFHFAGDTYVSRKAAGRRISHGYRKTARICRSLGHRQAAMRLLKKAIRSYPSDLRLYVDLAKAAFPRRADINAPTWEIPGPLPTQVTVSRQTRDLFDNARS